MKDTLPDSFKLNGSDNFLLTLDHMMQRRCGTSNICSLALKLNASITQQELCERVDAFSLFKQCTELRLRGGFLFSLPRWVRIGKSGGAIEFREGDVVLRRKLNPKKEAPVALDVFQTTEGLTLVFTWHHALMDAHGAEAFLKLLGNPPSETEDAVEVWQDAHDTDPFTNISETLSVKDFLKEKAQQPLGTLPAKKVKTPTTRYRVVLFSEEETTQIDQKALQAGAMINRSAFYLAACALACFENMPKPEDLLIPIPQDRRKKGIVGPLIGNQVTFLFYRVPFVKDQTIKDLVQSISTQTMNMMRATIPERYFKLMDLSRYIPQSLYRRLIIGPSRGQIASVFFSDTGHSLADFTTFARTGVKEIIHYPPNFVPPGISFIFSRPQHRLQYTFAYIEEEWTPERLTGFTNTVNHHLGIQPAGDCSDRLQL